jgi:hypothetical protein
LNSDRARYSNHQHKFLFKRLLINKSQIPPVRDDKEFGRTKFMISPVSSQSHVPVQSTQTARPQAASAPASQGTPASGQDKVELSAQAKAALSGGGDVDHDGDSH